MPVIARVGGEVVGGHPPEQPRGSGREGGSGTSAADEGADVDVEQMRYPPPKKKRPFSSHLGCSVKMMLPFFGNPAFSPTFQAARAVSAALCGWGWG